MSPGSTAPENTTVRTSGGEARITWALPAAPRAVLALGHGAGGGIQARDLSALAATLPDRRRVAVALVEQPWKVAGRRVAPAPTALDTAWVAVWEVLAERFRDLPVVAGGRSAGARVACRTAAALGAAAVVALAFPLRSPRARHPQGRSERARADELRGTGLPTLVVQGGRDPFGRPDEFTEAGFLGELVTVPHADHGFAVPKRSGTTEDDAVRTVTEAVGGWLDRLL